MNQTLVLVVAAGVALTACGRQIGDDCGSNVDCGSGRICDTSQPGGYCTVSPCRPDYCPSESICVEFTPDDTYCMRQCDANEECRKDYECVLGFQADDQVYSGFCNPIAVE
ncbi:MAG: hypothetical protein ISR64_11075 [Deltaproteobacteria bacterium]|nr:hypothetical protein [Deltaproteobacteria bacterium]